MDTGKKVVNLAVIGAGYWSRKAVTEYLRLAKVDSEFNLVQVCDLEEDNLSYCKDCLLYTSPSPRD